MKVFLHHYRVSKYDPAFCVDGVYQKEEWTSYSDVGLCFDGIMFTEEDYCRTEKQYIRFFRRILQETSTDRVEIVQLERYKPVLWRRGQMLCGEQLDSFLRDCLREKCWGRLENAALAFELGYDYYMHLACGIDHEAMESIVKEEGLFLEEWVPF